MFVYIFHFRIFFNSVEIDLPPALLFKFASFLYMCYQVLPYTLQKYQGHIYKALLILLLASKNNQYHNLVKIL